MDQYGSLSLCTDVKIDIEVVIESQNHQQEIASETNRMRFLVYETLMPEGRLPYCSIS